MQDCSYSNGAPGRYVLIFIEVLLDFHYELFLKVKTCLRFCAIYCTKFLVCPHILTASIPASVCPLALGEMVPIQIVRGKESGIVFDLTE